MLKFPKLKVSFKSAWIYPTTLIGFFSGAKIPGTEHQLGVEFGQLTNLPSQKRAYLCLGKKPQFNYHRLRMIARIWVRTRFQKVNYDLTSLETTQLDAKTIATVILQTLLQYHYPTKNHKTKKLRTPIYAVNLLSSMTKPQLNTLANEQSIIMEHVNFCCDLQNEAPNLMTPEHFVSHIKAKAKENSQLKMTVWDQKKLAKADMNLFLSVAAGSQHPPRLIELTYQGAPQSPTTTALIGKGITFDTGGYSLKPPQYQLNMKFDMSGAAIVCSALLAIAKLKLPVNVVAIACLSENLIGQKATLVESVIKSKSGLTVEITNTDAEGRLVLADAITYAFDTLKVNAVIELSTLTGAISVTLGDNVTGAFTTNKTLYNQFWQACKVADEPLWPLPVTKFNVQRMRRSAVADLVNASSDYRGGASNAAAFLFAFAKNRPFLHLDIAGTATAGGSLKTGTAVMLKSLVQFFHQKTATFQKSFKLVRTRTAK